MDYLNDCNSYINSKSSFIKDIEKNLRFYRLFSTLPDAGVEIEICGLL